MEITPISLSSAANATKASMVASLTFLLYDYFLVLESEVGLVWARKWTVGKGLFLINRYWGMCTIITYVSVFFTGGLSDKFCTGFLSWWVGASEIATVVNVEVIEMARVYAVYGRPKKLSWILVVLLFLETVSTAILGAIDQPSGSARSLPISVTGCYAVARPTYYFLCWLPCLMFETLLCSLMLYKAWRTYRDENGSPFLIVLIRDSVMYFLMFLVVMLLNCLLWARSQSNQIIAELALGWVIAIPCALGSRLLLNMRERYFLEEECSFSEERILSGYPSQYDSELHSIQFALDCTDGRT